MSGWVAGAVVAGPLLAVLLPTAQPVNQPKQPIAQLMQRLLGITRRGMIFSPLYNEQGPGQASLISSKTRTTQTSRLKTSRNQDPSYQWQLQQGQ